MKRFFQTVVLFFVIMTCISGQKPPIKFGDVDMEDMQMTVYPADTSAPAVILCDYGFFRAGIFQFTRTLRIKILKKEGYSWANHSFPTGAKSTIKGITYNLENGKVIQDKLKNESIFTERVTDQNYRTRIAMPNVKVGSVIDLQFLFTGIPFDWNFQETIPVRYNELVIESSPYVRFKYNFYGFERLSVSTPTRWVANNMPSFKIEPFMNSEENYLTKLEIDVLELVGYHQMAVSWDAIFHDLLWYDNFGKALDLSGYLNDLASSIKLTGAAGVTKIRMAFDSVRQNIKWDKKESLVTSTPTLGSAFKKKVGNSADINLILLQLLKKLDINVVPVALSTRSNGILSPLSPSYSRLNYVITLATIDTTKYLLDATEEYMPYYLLPLRCLNYNGQTVIETGSKHIDLSATRQDKQVTMYNLEMDGELNLKGEIQKINSDYAALDFRHKYHTFNSPDEYLEDFKKDKVGLTVNNVRLDNLDSLYKPVYEDYKVSISGKVNSMGNGLFILPMVYDQMLENPFKTTTRKFPIDFGYKSERTVITTIRIPAGYEINVLPSTIIMKMPDNSAIFLYEAVSTGSEIKITGKFTVNKSLIMPDQYLNFREFYDQIIKKQSEPVILKKV
jgi:hypothetical protein